MAIDMTNTMQGKNKDEIWNMFCDMLSEKLIKLSDYFLSKKK